MVTRFISKGKGRKRKSIPITPKKKGVTVRSVSLEPQAIQKINKKTIKTLNKGESANFSSSLNKIVISSRLKRDVKQKPIQKVESIAGIADSVLSSYYERNRNKFEGTGILALHNFGTNRGFRQLNKNAKEAVAEKYKDEFNVDFATDIPPRILDKTGVEIFEGRAFHIHDSGSDLAVDEYTVDQNGEFVLISNTGFWQGSEERRELLKMVRGGERYSEKGLLEALDSAGALQELHPPV